MSETHLDLALRTAVVAGAVAGDITVTGIREGDVLKAVQVVDEAGPNVVDEFTITAANTINNAGGTSTADTLLLIIWIAAHPQGGSLTRS